MLPPDRNISETNSSPTEHALASDGADKRLIAIRRNTSEIFTLYGCSQRTSRSSWSRPRAKRT